MYVVIGRGGGGVFEVGSRVFVWVCDAYMW